MTATKLELIRGGNVLDISDEISYVHEENDGFGMAPLHRLTERGPMQDGVTDRGYRLDPRIVTLVIPIIGASWEDRYTRRQEILRFLRPGDTPVILRFTDPSGNIYQLDGHLQSGPLFGTKDMWGNQFKAVMRLVCPDPTWYGDSISVVFELGGGSDSGMRVPTTIPHTIGASVIDSTIGIDYDGTYRSYPIIRIVGPIDDCIITNETTGDKLDFSGVSIAPGDWYLIDCRYGYKTIVDSNGANKVTDLTTDSDLATFSIEIDEGQEITPNAIRVSGNSISTATKVYITVYKRYIGV